MEVVGHSALRRTSRDGAYPALAAAAVFMAGAVAMMRWGLPLPELALAGDPIEEIDAPEATQGLVFPEEEPLGATDPVEEMMEPEATDTSPGWVEPGVTTMLEPPEPDIVVVPQTAPGQTLPRGHWVLFDRDGEPVDAIVQPWCISAVDDCPRYGPMAPSCVWIEYLGQQHVRVPYRLSDGDPNACYEPSGMDRDTWIPPPPEIAGALSNAPYSLELVYWD